MIVSKLLNLFEYLSDLEVEYALNEEIENFEPFNLWTWGNNCICINFQNFEPPNEEELQKYGIVKDEFLGTYVYLI
jgi:hypothetical protein